jgi:hypothetical protein
MKAKIENFMNSYVLYAIYALLFFSMLSSFRSCGTNREVSKLKKEVGDLNYKVDSLTTNIYTKPELDIRMSIEGYEISKRMLYDQNAIVRTIVRPDDRMNEYDSKIKELRAKIK